ncbi:hypothetical protein [Bradyrhizobium sp.]|uniref:hypothetical protein n=1 Tax=Bradyrhizobium sp. TaxID=376 RepID=UPI002736700B|nr:hypothetical protein [Bradyrhizobium sp.]MDP3078696.1 hypothetical protein [Bradyrhizobium sp.]
MIATIVNLFKNHLGKVLLVFVLGGASAVLGLIPGTENVSNVAGDQINAIKAEIGTAVSPTVQ